MQTTDYIWHNGKFVSWHDAKIHVLTHSLHYGAAAFEGIRAYKTEQGPAIFRLPEHIERLFYSASVVNMKIPYTEAELIDVTKELVRKNKLEHCYIRPIAYYGYGKMGVDPRGAPVEVSIACWPWGAYLPHDMVDIETSSIARVHHKTTVADAKLSGNYLNGIFSILKKGAKYHEALLLDANSYIAEGPGENLFIVKDNVLYTPKLGHILAGITRQTLIELAKKEGHKVEEKELSLEEAYNADEAFFTGTAAEVTPIKSIDNKIIGKGVIGPVTKKLRTIYLDVVHGKNKEFLKYLTFV